MNTPTTAQILVFDPARRTNADLIADAARIGWLPEPVLDATYGLGRFWTKYRPEQLVTNDLHKPADHAYDWTQPFPEHMHRQYGSVVFDGPYKEQGTASAGFAVMNSAYGVDVTRTQGSLHTMLEAGVISCSKLVRPGGFLLVKCQDQIVCGRFTSQTEMFRAFMDLPGWAFESHLHLTSTPRPQRSQVKPRNNYSTLLAFRRRR